MSWVKVGNTDIHYVEQGHPSAPPMVLLHGLSACGETWYQHMAVLSRSYHVMAYDSVNHGLSSNSPVDEIEPDRVDELQGFLEALDITRPVLAGHSMGSGTIVRWASKHPSDAAGLVISGGGVAPTPGTPRVFTPIPDEQLMVPVADAFTEHFVKDRQDMWRRYERMRSTATRLEYLRRPRQGSRPNGAEFEALVKQITSPVLLLIGSEDAALPSARHMHELVPHSELVEFPGERHNFYFEIPDAYIAAMDSWLARNSLPTAKVAV